MIKIYRHRTAFPDKFVGHIDPDTGDVFKSRVGPDKKIGHVDFSTGKVYRRQFGPDDFYGKVALDNG